MAPPTSLAIKTSAVLRLIKEESLYHKELVLEKNRLAKMEADGESDEYAIKQQVRNTGGGEGERGREARARRKADILCTG